MDRRTREHIEAKVAEVHELMWSRLPTPKPRSIEELINVLDPAFAASLLGIRFEYLPELTSQFRTKDGLRKLGGLIDRQRGYIAVAENNKHSTILFTAAHELGHFVLHDDLVMHRDLPVDGTPSGSPLPPKEREANYYAACFLMPPNLTRKAFERNFQTKAPLVINDRAAFWLSASDPDSLLRADHGSLARETAVASAERFGQMHFNSLATLFGVSVGAMAIRLRELGLVKAWP